MAALLLALSLCPCSALAAGDGAAENTETATAPAQTEPPALYPTEVLEYTAGDLDEPRISKTYELSPTDDPALIPTEDFERSGRVYTLLDIIKEDQTETDSKYYTETVTLDSKSKDMGAVLALLPQTKEFITEDGLSGVLTLKLDTVKVEAAGYGSSTKTVTATRTYPGLANQDTQYIPKTIQDGGNSMTLQTVNWQTEGDGHFTAMASYSGSATSSYVKGYTVTADYAGTVSRINLNKIRYVAIFEGTALDPVPSTPADQTDPTGQEAQTGEKNSILPVVAVVAAVLLGGGAFYFIKRRR